MLTKEEIKLFDKKISIINNKLFRDRYIAEQADDYDVGLVALWNTPVLFYELKKAYPSKTFYYVEFEILRDVYGVDNKDAIYIKNEEELANIMNKFRNPKLLINPPYSIGGKIIAKCKEVCPAAKYSVLMPLAQYKTKEVIENDGSKHKLFEYINTIKIVGGDGFDAAITKNNCITTLSEKPDTTKTYLQYMLKSFDQRYIEFYLWNIEHYCGYTWTAVNNQNSLNKDTDFIDMSRFVSTNVDSGGSHGYHGKEGCGYAWNVLHSSPKLIASLVKLSFKTNQGRENYNKYAYNWTTNKYNCLASKTIYGLNTTSISSEYYMLEPQIDWDNIHTNQKDLWEQGLYDEAILAEMGLKWEGEKIVKA